MPVLILLTLLVGSAVLPRSTATAAPAAEVSAYDLIIAMNTRRVSNGLPALVEDPIINAVAQSTAQIMAASQISSHIGNVSGRLEAAGYGGGAKVWATENFAAGNYALDEIMVIWSDAAHMLPAVNAAYCNVGAGVAKSANGRMYYVLQAAYVAGQSCGEYTSSSGAAVKSGGSARGVGLVVPVKIATPDADGKIFHVVQSGQSFWAIAIAYQVTIKDLEAWNNLSRDSKLQVGQRLFIPGSNTEGYATPTPVGMIQLSTPDAEGKVVHVVQAYQTLNTIAQAYQVNLHTILSLNGIQVDAPLQIGAKLVIQPSTLSPLQKLTPASDGKYYHVVKSGETLSWIARLYEVGLGDLMAWNGLTEASILRPEQQLLLQVTPPASPTPTSRPVTPTPGVEIKTATPTPAQSATHTPTPGAPGQTQAPFSGRTTLAIWLIGIGLVLAGALLLVWRSQKNSAGR